MPGFNMSDEFRLTLFLLTPEHSDPVMRPSHAGAVICLPGCDSGFTGLPMPAPTSLDIRGSTVLTRVYLPVSALSTNNKLGEPRDYIAVLELQLANPRVIGSTPDFPEYR